MQRGAIRLRRRINDREAGQEVIIPTSVSDEEANRKYPQGFKTQKPYLRTVTLK